MCSRFFETIHFVADKVEFAYFGSEELLLIHFMTDILFLEFPQPLLIYRKKSSELVLNDPNVLVKFTIVN